MSSDSWTWPSLPSTPCERSPLDDDTSLLNLESIDWTDEATLVDKYAHPDVPEDRCYIDRDILPCGMVYKYVMTQKITSAFYIAYNMTTASKYAVKRIQKRRVRFSPDSSGASTPDSEASQEELISCFVGKREDGRLRQLRPHERYFYLSADWGNNMRDQDGKMVWIERTRIPFEVSQTHEAYESSAAWYMFYPFERNPWFTAEQIPMLMGGVVDSFDSLPSLASARTGFSSIGGSPIPQGLITPDHDRHSIRDLSGLVMVDPTVSRRRASGALRERWAKEALEREREGEGNGGQVDATSDGDLQPSSSFTEMRDAMLKFGGAAYDADDDSDDGDVEDAADAADDPRSEEQRTAVAVPDIDDLDIDAAADDFAQFFRR